LEKNTAFFVSSPELVNPFRVQFHSMFWQDTI